MSAFDTARDLRIPGVVISQVHIDTGQLSVRMKNMVKDMLRKGIVSGGWSSKARQVAEKLAEGRGIRLVVAREHGFFAPHRALYDPDVAERVCELISADEMLELANDQNLAHTRDYTNKIMHRTRERHDASRATVRNHTPATHSRWCHMYSSELSQEVAKVFAENRSDQELAAAEELCGCIDRSELIAVPITL